MALFSEEKGQRYLDALKQMDIYNIYDSQTQVETSLYPKVSFDSTYSFTFTGRKENKEMEKPLGTFHNPVMVDKIIYNGRTTIVIWKDGSKTKATCSEEDIFDKHVGFAVCLAKKVYGTKLFKRITKRGQVQRE